MDVLINMLNTTQSMSLNYCKIDMSLNGCFKIEEAFSNNTINNEVGDT